MVTSRSAGDDLTDDRDGPTSDITAPPRQQQRKLASANSGTGNSAPAGSASRDDAVSDGTAGGGISPNGAPAAGKEAAPAPDAQAYGGSRPAADETIVDGVPALPADIVGSSRSVKSKAPEPAPADSPAVSGSPAVSSGPPPHAPANPAVEDPTIAYPAQSPVKPVIDAVPPGPAVPAPASGALSSGAAPPPGSRPAPADPPLSPAAFAWEMPDPPPSSPSSPARTFLRSGTTPADPAAPKAGPAAAGGPAQPPTGHKGPAQKARQKRTTARQAHLTVARVEPWSVMKFSFVVSLVAFVILFVAVSVLYGALSGLGVFDSIQKAVNSVTSSQGSAGVNAKAWFSASRVLGYTALLGSLNIVLITAMSTIGSVVYNLTSRLVGGIEVTLKETE